jgi:hypothetical protein
MKPSLARFFLAVLLLLPLVGSASSNVKKEAEALADCTDEFADDFRGRLREFERWPAQGSDAHLWNAIENLRDDAFVLRDNLNRRVPHRSTSLLVNRIGERIRTIRTATYVNRLDPGAEQQLWRIQGFHQAIAADYNDYDYEQRPVRYGYRAASTSVSPVVYSQSEPSNVSTHQGQTEYIRANSAARHYVRQTYGVKNESITTRSIKPKGDGYLVALDAPAGSYELTVDAASGRVVKAKTR